MTAAIRQNTTASEPRERRGGLVFLALLAVVVSALFVLSPRPAEASPPAAAQLKGCLGLDIACSVVGSVAGSLVGGGPVGAVGGLVGSIGKSALGAGGVPDPFAALGNQVASAAADAWTKAMLALWGAGLFVLRLVLQAGDSFLTPDISADGPGRTVYAYTFWIASTLALLMGMVQLGVAALQRQGRSLARLGLGAAQFAIVWAAGIGYCVLIVNACAALSRALMKALLGVDGWASWDPMKTVDLTTVTDGAAATALGLLGLVLWLAALGHLLVMLARAASLLVLVATSPIAAAGLLAEVGSSWFWKALRWFHAAALTPVLMVLVLGIGVQLATGVAAGASGTVQQSVGTALPAVMLICLSCVAPLALFKMLAFVDPGTPSGASFRQGVALQGGVQGLLGGAGSDAGASTSATTTDQHGRSGGESGAESTTDGRFGASQSGSSSGSSPAGGLSGMAGALGRGMGLVQQVGTEAAALFSDQGNQAGVGHHTYGPDFSNLRGSGGAASAGRLPHPEPDQGHGGDAAAGSSGGAQEGLAALSRLPIPPP